VPASYSRVRGGIGVSSKADPSTVLKHSNLAIRHGPHTADMDPLTCINATSTAMQLVRIEGQHLGLGPSPVDHVSQT
jgi:hypothetical protein